MKLLIVGSRSIEDFDLSPYITEDVELIISGGASGADRIAENYADKHGISKLILRPEYKRYGKAAPAIRNKEMVAIADAVIAIWDEKSRGTLYTIEYARKAHKPLTLITVKDGKAEIATQDEI